ncbi:hypothetical protein ACJZ2D_017154 [Fusarium nematophilum]
MILAEIAMEADFPDAVLNIIQGTHRAVNFIIDEPAIKAISFVGRKCGRFMALATVAFVGSDTQLQVDGLVASAKQLEADGGFEDGADLGPVISPESKSWVEHLMVSAEEDGATIVLDGRGYAPSKCPPYSSTSINQNEYANSVTIFTNPGTKVGWFQRNIEAG